MLRVEEVLEKIFLEHGFLRMTTRELARRARCSKRDLYALAPSRDELFKRIVARYLSRIERDMVDAAHNSRDPSSALAAYLDAAVRDTRAASTDFVRDLHAFTPTRTLFRRVQKKRVEGLEEILESGARTGIFNPIHPKVVAEVMLLAAARMSDPRFLADADLSMSRAYEELIRLVNHGLLAKTPRKLRRP